MSEVHTDAVETPLAPPNPVDAAAELIEIELGLKDAPTEQPEAVEKEPELEAAPEEAEEIEGESPEAGDESPVIDYDLEIPMPEGRDALTVGQLKDAVVQAEREAQSIIESQNEIMRERDQLRSLIQAAQGNVPPEVQQAMQSQMRDHLEREHQAMLTAIPEWKEESVFRSERQEIVDLGAEYGFSPEDISQVADHRAVKMLRDYARLKRTRAQNVEQFEKAAKPKPKRKAQTRSRTAGRDRRFEAARNGSVGDKVSAINELLTG
jgi:hypothetical protein